MDAGDEFVALFRASLKVRPWWAAMQAISQRRHACTFPGPIRSCNGSWHILRTFAVSLGCQQASMPVMRSPGLPCLQPQASAFRQRQRGEVMGNLCPQSRQHSSAGTVDVRFGPSAAVPSAYSSKHVSSVLGSTAVNSPTESRTRVILLTLWRLARLLRMCIMPATMDASCTGSLAGEEDRGGSFSKERGHPRLGPTRKMLTGGEAAQEPFASKPFPDAVLRGRAEKEFFSTSPASVRPLQSLRRGEGAGEEKPEEEGVLLPLPTFISTPTAPCS